MSLVILWAWDTRLFKVREALKSIENFSFIVIQGAVMYPWYHGYRGNGDLPEDDRLAIQEIYGAREGRQWGPTSPTRVTRRTTTRATKPTRTTRRYNTKRYDDRSRKTSDTAGRRNRVDTNYPERPRYYPSVTTSTSRSVERTTSSHSTRHHHRETDRPDTCNTNYDAISIIRGEIFVFKGRYLWRIGSEGLLRGYPHEILKMWNELPKTLTHIDTVYENKRRQIVFFVGSFTRQASLLGSLIHHFYSTGKQYYVFHSQNLLPGYPKPLSALGLPATVEKIDAALVWGHNNRTYFYSGEWLMATLDSELLANSRPSLPLGTMYWRFDEDEMHVELDYPRDMSMWKGIGYDIDSAFQNKDGKLPLPHLLRSLTNLKLLFLQEKLTSSRAKDIGSSMTTE